MFYPTAFGGVSAARAARKSWRNLRVTSRSPASRGWAKSKASEMNFFVKGRIFDFLTKTYLFAAEQTAGADTNSECSRHLQKPFSVIVWIVSPHWGVKRLSKTAPCGPRFLQYGPLATCPPRRLREAVLRLLRGLDDIRMNATT
jgi:hypothetical protein